MGSFRAFVAFKLPDDLQKALKDYQRDLRRCFPYAWLRWVPAQNIHLTLKFLGHTDEAVLPQIEPVLHSVASNYSAISIEIDRPRLFPNPSRARGIWVGVVSGGTTLKACAAELEAGLTDLGVAKALRAFNPHLTLARFRRAFSRHDLKQLVDNLPNSPELPVQSVLLKELILYQSDLHPGGARYTERLAYSLQDGNQEN